MLILQKGPKMANEKILLLQPIFCPSESQFERNANSLISLGEYLAVNKITNVECQFGGWCKTPELWNKILVILKKYFPNHEITSFKNNVGKAVTINFLYKKHVKPHHEFMMSVDSDMVFPLSTENFFDRMIKASEFATAYKKTPFGLMAPQQLEHGCHLSECFQNNYQFSSNVNGKIYSERLIWPTGAGGIAGGLLLFSRKAWEVIGGYRVMGLYSGEDAYSLLDIGAHGFTYQVLESAGIIHPKDEDILWAQQKVKVCQRDSGSNKTDLTPFIKEMDEFWEGRN
jgi:hypothetical protein